MATPNYQEIVDAIDNRIHAVMTADTTTLNDLHNKKLDGLSIDRNTTLGELLKLRNHYAHLLAMSQGVTFVETEIVGLE